MEQYRRLLNKDIPPDEGQIQAYLGTAFPLFEAFDAFFRSSYDMRRSLVFPFGNNYGWGYKYAHKTLHICYLFFENNAFTIMLQIGKKAVSMVEAALPAYLPKTQELWKNRYPCGDEGAGWLHYRVLCAEELRDIEELIKIKKSPDRK